MKTRLRLLIISLTVLFVFTSCSSLVASMELGNAKNRAKENKYVEAVDSAASALLSSEYKNGDAAVLLKQFIADGDAYYNSLISEQKQIAKGNSFAIVYDNYLNLIKMYTIITSNNLQSFSAGGSSFTIDVVDYSAQLSAARDQAGKIYYDSAVSNMQTKTLAGYRQAFTNLEFVKNIYSGVQCPLPDLNALLQQAYNEATFDIYVVTPVDLDMEAGTSSSMGELFRAGVIKDSKWVKFHQGRDIDLAYQAWDLLATGENFMDSASGAIKNSTGVLEFGKEIGADLVIYAAFANLEAKPILEDRHTDSFEGSAEDQPYVLDLTWKKYSKQTKLDLSYFVVDVQNGKTILQRPKNRLSRTRTYYTGTYTITPEVFLVSSTINFAELLNISDIQEDAYGLSGSNGYAHRVRYSAEREASDSKHFTENLENWKRNATPDVQRTIVLEAAEEVSKAIAHLL